MGMLDDAIREHLELKRLKGTDPGEVARQERDALGPAPRREDAAPEQDRPAADDEEEGPAAHEQPPALGSAASRPNEHVAGQETLEINMEAELAGDPQATPPQSAGRDAPAERPDSAKASPDDSLEWEVPGDRATRGEQGAEDGQPSADEDQLEDVLEETPTFLRETPEHERLWFEQRPPRDFDFNE